MARFGEDFYFIHFATTNAYRWYYLNHSKGALPFSNKTTLNSRALSYSTVLDKGTTNLYLSSTAGKPCLGVRPPVEGICTLLALRVTEYPKLHELDQFHLCEFLDYAPGLLLTKSLGRPSVHTFVTQMHHEFYQQVREWAAAREASRPIRISQIQDLPYLLPVQQEHVKRSIVISEEHRCLLNDSKTGAGKSTMGAALAKYHMDKYGDRLIILCPLSAIEAWRVALDRVGIPEADLYTFSFLSNHQIDWPAPEGLFVIIDECHSIKNNDSNVSQLVRRLIARRPKLLMVSATVCEGFTKGDVAYLLDAIGFARLGFHPQIQELLVRGAKTIKVFKDCVRIIVSAFAVRAPLQSEFVQEHQVSLYQSPLASERSIRAWYNVLDFYNRRKHDSITKLERYERLRRFLENVPRPPGLVEEVNAMANFTKMHVDNEAESAAELVKVALQQLCHPDHYSLLIVSNFTEAREYVAKALVGYAPFVFRASDAEAQARMHDFQAGRLRVIIGTYAILKQSRDFDDQLGGRPRCMVRTPVASLISESQICGRIERTTTRSQPINIVVCAEGSVEEHIYRLNQEKRDQFLNFLNKN